ncbi:rho guanine nucleotide exchange factor 33 [Petromyzon marinus]|uniref:rho guanine nucleotide exchange factor 33 n=1 Tax=Petromyzon marinus TaxID=7757 RepID=UPI003F71FDC5
MTARLLIWTKGSVVDKLTAAPRREMATEVIQEDDLAAHITQLHTLVSELKEGFTGAVQELARIQYGDSYLEERIERDRAECAQQTQQLKELLLGLKDELADVAVQLRKVSERQASLEQQVEALASERSCAPAQRQTPVTRRALFAGAVAAAAAASAAAAAPELSPRSSCSSTDALPSVSSEVTADSGVHSEEPGSLSSSSASQACRSTKNFKQHQVALPYEGGETCKTRAAEKTRTRHRHTAVSRSKERTQPAREPNSASANGCGNPTESRAFLLASSRVGARTPTRMLPGDRSNGGTGAKRPQDEADDDDSMRDASILDFQSDDASSTSSLEATSARPARAAVSPPRADYGVLGDGDGTDGESTRRLRFPAEVTSRRRPPPPRNGDLAGRLSRCGVSEEDILARLESDHGYAQSRFARSLARSRTTENVSMCVADVDPDPVGQRAPDGRGCAADGGDGAALAATPTRGGKSQQRPARNDDGRFGLRDSLRKLFNKKSSTVRFADPPVSRPRSNTPSRALGIGNLRIEDFLDCGEPCSAV